MRAFASCVLVSSLLASSAFAQRGLTLEDVMAIRQVSDPRISPDSSRVVYTISEIDMKANEENVDLWLVSIAGGAPRRLTFQTRDDRRARRSPDDASIAFLSERDSVDDDGNCVGQRTQIWLMPLDGGEARQLTSPPSAVSEFGRPTASTSMSRRCCPMITAPRATTPSGQREPDVSMMGMAYGFVRLSLPCPSHDFRRS
jgi:WD40-like Beta Propeller Repeat